MPLIRLSVDFEFSSRTWWEEGGRELWEGIAEAFDASSVIVDEGLATSWLDQARQLPGWDAGADYAPHPVTSRPVEDDEELY